MCLNIIATAKVNAKGLHVSDVEVGEHGPNIPRET
jgi:hypothetical protein